MFLIFILAAIAISLVWHAVQTDIPKIIKPSSSFDWKKNEEVDEITFNFSPGDMRHFTRMQSLVEAQQFDQYVTQNTWRRTKLTYQGDVYQAQVKMHGLAPTAHSLGGFVNSYNIRLSKGKTIKGYSHFKLLVADRFLFGLTVMRMGDLMGVYSLPSMPMHVNFNDHLSHNYFFTVAADDAWTEQKQRNTLIFFEENTREKGDRRLKAFIFDTESHEWSKDRISELEGMLVNAVGEKKLNPKLSKAILDKHEALNNDIIDNDLSRFEDYFDVEYLARFFATLILTGENGHLGIIGNQKVGYDYSNGKFYPILHWDAATQPRFRPPEEEWGNIRSHTFFRKRAGSIRRNPLYSFALQHDRTRWRILEILNEFLEDADLLKPVFELPHEFLTFDGNDLHRLHSKLRSELDMTKVEPKILKSDGEFFFSVTSKTLVPIDLKGIWIEFCGNEALENSYVNIWRHEQQDCGRYIEIDHIRHHTSFKLRRKGVSESRLNTLGEEKFHSIQRLPKFAELQRPGSRFFLIYKKNSKYFSQQASITSMAKEDPPTLLTSKTFALGASEGSETFQDSRRWLKYGTTSDNDGELLFTFFRKEHVVLRDLIFPSRTKIVILPGTTFSLGANVSLLFRGELVIQGTPNEPIVFSALNPNEPFGVVAGIGDEDNALIHNVKIANASEALINGAYISGALSLHDYNAVSVREVKITDAHGEDAINIKFSKTCELIGLHVEGVMHDGIDVDYCEGTLKSIYIEASGLSIDENGDGMDFSGSYMTVTDVEVKNFLDKGVSIGEKSLVGIHSGKLLGNRFGIAVKDSSCAIIGPLIMNSKEADITAYNKKKNYGTGTYSKTGLDEFRNKFWSARSAIGDGVVCEK